MKQVIENWLKENTNYKRLDSLQIDFLYFTYGHEVKGKTKDDVISELASQLAAHIENSKSGH